MKKQSIRAMLSQILTAAALLSVMLGLISVMMLFEAKSKEGIVLLQQMKQQASRLHAIDTNDPSLAKILFTGARNQLLLSKEQFDATLHAFNPLSVIFPYAKDFHASEVLQGKLEDFFTHAEPLLIQNTDRSSANLFDEAFDQLMAHLHAMTDNAVAQEQRIDMIRQSILYTLFVLSLLLLVFIPEYAVEIRQSV